MCETKNNVKQNVYKTQVVVVGPVVQQQFFSCYYTGKLHKNVTVKLEHLCV